MQEGIENAEAAALLTAAGIDVVMDRCIKREHERLFGPEPHISANTGRAATPSATAAARPSRSAGRAAAGSASARTACMENVWGMSCNGITWDCPDCGAPNGFGNQ